MNMNSLAKDTVHFGRHQIRNARKWISGYPLVTPSLVSGTLDLDDIALAKSQIMERKGWFDADKVGEYERAFAQWNGWPLFGS